MLDASEPPSMRNHRESKIPRLAADENVRHVWTMLAIPILIIALCVGVCRWASGRFEVMLARASKEPAPTAHTGSEVAKLFLTFEEIRDVEIVEHNSTVTNYFDPTRRRLFLSSAVAKGTTMAAWTLALHEAGHATQTGEMLGDVKWRQSVIKMTRYGPVFAALAAVLMIFFLRFPPRFAMMGFGAMCVIFLLLNAGTLAVEFNANARLRNFLEKHLSHHVTAYEKLESYLHRAATRELGDLLSSPRYFFFSALPGSGASRPTKSAKE
jgi:Zn-dependent membrane protease YugP